MCEGWGTKRNSKEVNRNDEFAHVSYDIFAIFDIELNHWLAKFVVEVREKETGEVCCGNTSYQMVCGFQGFTGENGRPELNVFEQPEFKLFRDSLDAEMKRLILRRCWRKEERKKIFFGVNIILVEVTLELYCIRWCSYWEDALH